MKREHGAFALIVTIFAMYGVCLVLVCWGAYVFLGLVPAAIGFAMMVLPVALRIPGEGRSCSGGSDCNYTNDAGDGDE